MWNQVERRLAEEADRTAHYLSSFTHQPLQDLLVAQLLTPHLQAILDSPGTGLVSMVDTDKISDLRRMYDQFMLVPEHEGRDALRMALRMDIEERGKAVNQGALEPEAGPSGVATPVERDQPMEDDIKGKGKARAPAPSTAANALSSALRWVQDTLDLKDKFDRLLEQAFNGDISVQTSINEVS